MGYITTFDLQLIGDEKKVKKFKYDLLRISEDEDGNPDEDVQELVDTGYVCAKCYNLQDWMDRVAEKNPDVLAILSGDGEESDDQWEERYKGTIFERQIAIIPPFETEELLTEKEKQERNNK